MRNCYESNKPEAKFYAKIKFVVSFDAFNKAAKEAEERIKEIEDVHEKLKYARED